MKAGWATVALGSVCDKIQDGAHQSPKETYPTKEPGTFPYVTSKNIRNWHLDKDNITFVDRAFHDAIYPRCNAMFGDVLLTKDGANTGQVTLNTFDEPISLLSSVCLIKPNRAKLDPRFLVYYIQSDFGFENFTGQMTGAAIKRIILKNIKTSAIPLPPLGEQQRIVAVLDEAFEGLTRARAHAEANLQNARELFDKRLTRAFVEVEGDANTPTATVAEVAHPRKGSIRTGPFGSQLLHSEFTESGIAVLGIDNAVKNEFRWSRYRFISPEKYADLKRYTVFPGDVIITIMGTCGRCAVVPDDIPTAINTKHLCCITLDQTKCLPNYLHCYFLHSPTALEYLAQNATGSVMDGLNMGLIKELPVRLPSLEHQARVVELFQAAKADAAALQLHYETKLQSLDALRQSLLQKAFAGELT